MRLAGSVAHRLVALPLAVLLAAGAALVPAAVPAAPGLAPLLSAIDVPVARAANGIAITTDARYVVVPEQATVRVTVDIAVRNEQPNTVSSGVITRYYYDAVDLGVQPEAARIRATERGVAVPVHVVRRKGYKLVSIGLRENLYHGDATTVRLTFELPSGAPRSASEVRVGRAFATFLAWAFGDSGTVRIEVPRPFTVSASGDELSQATTDSGTVLTASASDALAWYAWINARNDLALTREQLDITGGERLIVRGWPEDTRWRKRVATVLTKGVPELAGLVGLPWPVDGAITVVEVHTPLLEGYSGFYDPAKSEITVSEDLDDLTIVHEASHAWFNDTLFTGRWITEGLADEYASRVLASLGGKAQGPGDVKRTAKVAFPLEAWPPPAAIRDEQSSAREQYGYDASWLVVRRVVKAVGVDGMRAVFAAAADGTTAYVGAGTPERSQLPNDWRRFLDLSEEVGGATGVGDLLATWALAKADAAGLPAREHARDAYHALVAAGDGWAAPAAVRLSLDRWAFDEAETAITTAAGILAERDATAAEAQAEGLVPSDKLETAYEGAADAAALADARSLADATAASLAAIVAADEAAVAPRDWVVTLGLEGTDPDADLAAARAAWQAGDMDAAKARATEASVALADAPQLGQRRATTLGLGAGALLLVVLLAMVLAVIRRRRRRLARVAEAAERYATLPPSAAPGAEPGPEPNEEEGAEPS